VSAAAPAFSVRAADGADAAFLWIMLTYAASMQPGGEDSVAAAQADPYLRTYVEGWVRPGDVGVVACADGADARPLGAAWVRPGLQLAEPGAPELATAVLPGARGLGLGTAMMRALFARAAGSARAIVLSVREENPALHFYERLGFARGRSVRNRVGGVSFVMRRALGAR